MPCPTKKSSNKKSPTKGDIPSKEFEPTYATDPLEILAMARLIFLIRTTNLVSAAAQAPKRRAS